MRVFKHNINKDRTPKDLPTKCPIASSLRLEMPHNRPLSRSIHSFPSPIHPILVNRFMFRSNRCLLGLIRMWQQSSWPQGEIASSHNRQEEIQEPLTIRYRLHTGDHRLISLHQLNLQQKGQSESEGNQPTLSSVIDFQKCSIFLTVL